LILAVIIIVASFLRFWNIADVGLGGDEAVYAGQARILAGDNEEEMSRFFVLISRGSTNFLFHQGVQAVVYALLGFSDFTTRLVSATFSVLTVGLVFLLGREVYGRSAGLLGAFLLAINGYAVALGRMALLDSTMVFFFTLSMLFLAKWIKSGEPKWGYLLAAGTGVAIMAKVVSFLVIPIAIITMLILRQFRHVSIRTVMISALVFAASLSPAILQLASNYDVFVDFFSEGASRTINVPETYYLDKLIEFAGISFLALTIFGIAVALIFREKGDVQCLVWLAVVLIFFQLHPIKGWNYLLPLVPAATLLAGRGIAPAVMLFKRAFLFNNYNNNNNNNQKYRKPVLFRDIVVGASAVLLLAVTSYLQIYGTLDNIIYDRPFAGLREAAYWLEENDPDAGAMTISHGSAQYVLSLYAGIDAYPFGSYDLHTVLPGGATIAGTPPPDPLIQNGTVTYLVYYVSPKGGVGDDPIHNPDTPTEAQFVKLIRKYQSQLRYVFHDSFTGLNGTEVHNPRVLIYEVGKRLPEPYLEARLEGGNSSNFNASSPVRITGSGFLIDSYVNVYHGRNLLQKIPTDQAGSFDALVRVPSGLLCQERLVVFDEGGNRLPVRLEGCMER
jgi:hypothetical protein